MKKTQTDGAKKSEPGLPIEIGGVTVAPGEKRRIDLTVGSLPLLTGLPVPVRVINGRRAGPRLWLSAALHGDEINGVEIIREVLEALADQEVTGTIIACPIVNVFGFVHHSRYLPDRRDLNRSFPGSTRGSLAAQIARTFMLEIVERCTHGIDLHTGSHDRFNLPQIRADLDDPETLRCATAFGAPVLVHAESRDGSLREAAARLGIAILLFEGGEANRFDDSVIRSGVAGVLGVLRELGMIPASRKKKPRPAPLVSRETSWVRARKAGILRLSVAEGDRVQKGAVVAHVGDYFGEKEIRIKANRTGLIIGLARNPLVYRGDAIVHIAHVEDA